jgi:hypothetical protein
LMYPRSQRACLVKERGCVEDQPQEGVGSERSWKFETVPPFQGLVVFGRLYRGRCPGLTYFAPLGLTDARQRLGLRMLPHRLERRSHRRQAGNCSLNAHRPIIGRFQP